MQGFRRPCPWGPSHRFMTMNEDSCREGPFQLQPYVHSYHPPRCMKGKIVKVGPVGSPEFRWLCHSCASHYIGLSLGTHEVLERKGIVEFHEPSEGAEILYRDIIGEEKYNKMGFHCELARCFWGDCIAQPVCARICNCAKRKCYGNPALESERLALEASLKNAKTDLARAQARVNLLQSELDNFDPENILVNSFDKVGL
ncbi:uncharacterized protein LOC117646361 [Thrips palmi]|uniref:Uncharacterized protein LOC117646361 n=1 Tax=Thrips palmi TaxID=161013 RepID=A0A6P8YSX4_THRPL|nr:uncharacterized protein LOC117646361 [Thrips palmi]